MKILKYIYILVVSILLLIPAFLIFMTRVAIKAVVHLLVELPGRKLVFALMSFHEWLLSLVGFSPLDPLRTPRIPKI